MTNRAPLIVAMVQLSLLWTGLCFAEEKPPGEELFGEWEVVDMTFKGVVQTLKPGMEHVKFERDGISLSFLGKRVYSPIKCTFRPGEFDIVPDDIASNAIKAKYELKGDKLRIIWRELGGERPTDFDTSKDKRLTLRVLKSVAK